MNVWISIKGVQRAGDERQMLELDTQGVLERTADGFSLTYEESENTGMEGVTTVLTVSPTVVTMERRGAMSSLMVLEKGRRTLCSYDTGFGSLTMGLYARAIHTGMSDEGGTFDFHYTLDINAGMTSSHDVYVTVREASVPRPRASRPVRRRTPPSGRPDTPRQ